MVKQIYEGRWWGLRMIPDGELMNGYKVFLLVVTLLKHGNGPKWSRKTEAVLEHLSTWAFFVYKLELLSSWTLKHLPVCELSCQQRCQVVKLDMIDAVLEHLTKDFFPDEPIFRCNIITPESCENLVQFPRPQACQLGEPY